MRTKSKAFDHGAISSEGPISTRFESDAFDRKVVTGGKNSEKLNGSSGNDKIDGGAGNDTINGLGGDDTLIGGVGNDTVSGGNGNDVINGGSGKNRLSGDGGNDRVTGGKDADRIDGGAGNDNIKGLDGNDGLNGGDGNDTIYGGGGNDVINGGSGKNRLYGDGGNDRITGAKDADRIDGGAGNDTLNGGAGNDTLIGGAGQNKLFGGSGVDTAVFTGVVTDYTASYDVDGRLIIFKSGSEALLDKTVELIKFGDTTIDRRIVEMPIIISATTADGDVVSGATTTDSTLVLNGTSDPFARIVVYDGKTKIGVAVAGADGHWSFDGARSALSNGAHLFTVTASYGDDLPATTSAGATFTINAASYMVDLTTLSPSQGFVIEGEAKDDGAGSSVSSAGDVNGDGFNDIIIGANGNDRGGSTAGAVFVVFGKATGIDVDSNNVFDLAGLTADKGFIIKGEMAGDLAGNSVSSAGDVNGDGFDDIIVGARDNDDAGDKTGAAYVIFGTASGFGAAVAGQRVVDLSTLSASHGFIIKGDTVGDQAGWSVSSAGDVNGDGFGDMIVGAPYGDDGGDSAGEAYVIFGTASGFGSKVAGQRVIDLSTLTASQGFVLRGGQSPSKNGPYGSDTGASVSSAGDLNGDGFDDILVGAPLDSNDDPDPNDYSGGFGRAYVIFGTDSGFGTDVAGRQVIDLLTLQAGEGTYLAGSSGEGVGSAVSSAGDVNGDGFDDFIAGSVNTASVVFGGTELEFGFRIVDNYSDTIVHARVASAGDINGDGFDDLIVGGAANSKTAYLGGQAFVIFGAASFSGDVNVRSMTASQGFIIQSDTAYDSAGFSVASAGDINGDGFDDLMVGAVGAGAGDEGAAYILYGGAFGGDTTPIELTGTSSAEILIGAAGNDSLAGNGGADVYRSGAGNDHIVIKDAGFQLIDAGTGKRDVVVLDGGGFTLDARNFSNAHLTGIEGFDLTLGNNTLKLAAVDVFHFSTDKNGLFTATSSHNSLVIDGNDGDTLQLFDTGAANGVWETARLNRNLDGTAGGEYTFVNLVENGTDRVLASIAVDHDMTLVL
ncbi:FG-GAP repeat protein [Rhizobium sp. FKL33]|uniref:FG-GAP repeat protein n=1 Tax=Rhizobium sp. FKL33 TaxID=2562307 RepID=UPI0010BF7B95|nr:FG-GAP repeat protein [Rhizobium sp. FKL33]